MKKIFSFLLALCLCVSFFSSCRTNRHSENAMVVCTCFAQYDWTLEILGERAEEIDVVYLLDSGVDIHSYQPGYKDILDIKNCDLFICNGGISEEWMKDIFENENTGAKIVDLMALPDITLLEVGQDHEGHAHTDTCSHTHDEHVWLSLSNAAVFCRNITEELCLIDPMGESEYRRNCEEYTAQLDSLSSEFLEAASDAEKDIVLFADRYPFAYMMNEIGVECHAAFEGCSSEVNATYQTVTELIEMVDKYQLDVIAVTDGSNLELAEGVIARTRTGDQRIVSFDSMQSVSTDDIKNGKSYIKTMEQNLEALKDAVN